MYYQLIDRLYSLVGGENPQDPNFTVSGQIFVYGDKAFFFSAHGAGFYQLLLEHGVQIMRDLQIESLEGYVMPPHLRLLKKALRAIADVRVVHRGKMAGHEMVWIRATPCDHPADVTVDSGR